MPLLDLLGETYYPEPRVSRSREACLSTAQALHAAAGVDKQHPPRLCHAVGSPRPHRSMWTHLPGFPPGLGDIK